MKTTAKTKPYEISKREVFEAWKRVRANKGAPGVDKQSVAEFEARLLRNLYKLWNRMSSGSYFPKAVRRKEIPKKDGSMRPLGIPTVLDRVAQEVVRARLGVLLEPQFHEDSYGYRPGKSAIEAIKVCRERNWKYDWVLDIDIQKFFDTVSHELLLKAVGKHCKEKWMMLYIRRWLSAPIQHQDGRLEASECGTPQGGVISPLLANLYLHYAFDKWMERTYPDMKFERFADDIVCHCRSEEEALQLKNALETRLNECALKIHPNKTKVVYCKDYKRNKAFETISFDFLGYTFRPRKAERRTTGKRFTAFLPAVSQKAQQSFCNNLRKQRALKSSQIDVYDLALAINGQIRGWINYFKHFYKSALGYVYYYVERKLTKWIRRKHSVKTKRSVYWLSKLREKSPRLFAHWDLLDNTYGRFGRAV